MLHRLIFASALLAATTGSVLAQQTHTIDVWGARIEVPNQGPGGLFGDGAMRPRDGGLAAGATLAGIAPARSLAPTAPALLDTRGRRR
ncbi:hypothetical protein [Methylobacterium sp. SyP6R]|uniref:hypothetical protein n=1 Tax=Methylobacterium sp. SyP6R TaxID=2718876 RepID=UPI001F37DE38|nr:hypothetical protein [Methylobacterium sp. SyP6R]MCF4127755.1 hypothetical protein [Methylobacterium sp. SyP6R]